MSLFDVCKTAIRSVFMGALFCIFLPFIGFAMLFYVLYFKIRSLRTAK